MRGALKHRYYLYRAYAYHCHGALRCSCRFSRTPGTRSNSCSWRWRVLRAADVPGSAASPMNGMAHASRRSAACWRARCAALFLPLLRTSPLLPAAFASAGAGAADYCARRGLLSTASPLHCLWLRVSVTAPFSPGGVAGLRGRDAGGPEDVRRRRRTAPPLLQLKLDRRSRRWRDFRGVTAWRACRRCAGA